jgi:hypothetical protein
MARVQLLMMTTTSSVVIGRLSLEMTNSGAGAVALLTRVTSRVYLRAQYGLRSAAMPACQPGVSSAYRSTSVISASQNSAHCVPYCQ